jgi:hypothetical protein
MTTDEYEDATLELRQVLGEDDAVEAIFAACWHLYDDIKPHRMTGHWKLEPDVRRVAARWIVFLRSDKPYRGHELPSGSPQRADARSARLADWVGLLAFVGLVVSMVIGNWGAPAAVVITISCMLALLLLMLGGGGVSLNPEVFARAFGDPGDSWPFADPSELQSAIATPTYLCGR